MRRARRDFLALVGAGAIGSVTGSATLAGCAKRSRSSGAALRAEEIAALLPSYRPLPLVRPDVSGGGVIPDGHLGYPRELVRVIQEKPGRGGPPITTMTPKWGPIPPGLGRNSFLDAVNAELGVTVAPSLQDGSTFASKLSAILGARDLPDLLATPSWSIERVPRFSQAVAALFEDLTPHLQGSAVAGYPMLATLPTSAWQYCAWGGRLAAVPYPTDEPFPWALFYRKDLTERVGVGAPSSIDELYAFGKKMTDASRGIWAFGNTFTMVQMFFGCPGSSGGWRRKESGGLEHAYEVPEFRQALEFTVRLHREGMVHPDVIANRGADSKQLFSSGRLIAFQDGLGAWRGVQTEQAKVTPGFDMQPLPIFSALGGKPLSWVREAPMFYTFVKKGLGRARVEELLRVLNWCAAPFGSKEHELNAHGVEGKHFTRALGGNPVATALGQSEVAEQYRILGGRAPALVASAEVPTYLPDLLAYLRATLQHREPNLFAGIKLELPEDYSRLQASTEDKITDILRGRRPVADLAPIVGEWRRSGGDESRAFFEKALADGGRG